MRQAENLGKLGRDQQHGAPGCCLRRDKPVDVELHAHVDALRRLHEDENLRVEREALRQRDFLLVAAAQVEHQLIDARRLDVERLDLRLRDGALLRRADEAERIGDPPQHRQRDILADAHLLQHALGFAVFRQVDQPARQRPPRLRLERLALERDVPAVERQIAKQRATEFGFAAAGQSGDRQHLAAMQAEAHVIEQRRARSDPRRAALPHRAGSTSPGRRPPACARSCPRSATRA